MQRILSIYPFSDRALGAFSKTVALATHGGEKEDSSSSGLRLLSEWVSWPLRATSVPDVVARVL